ncbi:hypothetical protein HYH02_012035 [Chlamydomonas schloesseri]|uniref:SRCR domain-containing protein n=1 Tax=Chlamydomonas schloesseri TaxID=2026947 RepID=A0A835SXN6_9CHLO|nr:hypothetical protein HYH02_012035 [Chlamydomonas schloesseri]|eukprot:KAG2435038.1 hypothetical protein HYH02_012035 [Chlamydomonas schloesseri]
MYMHSDGALRLVSSSNVSAAAGQGVLQLFFGGVWGTLHHGRFGRREARTACRQLGWTTGSAVQDAANVYGPVLGPVRYPGLTCELQHDRLADCRSDYGFNYVYTTVTASDTSFTSTAGVQCRNEPPGTEGALRIYGTNASQGLGTLMMFHNGVWGNTLQDYWDWVDARVACRQMGWRTGRLITEAGARWPSPGPVWYSGPTCEHWMSRLSNCSFTWPDLNEYMEDAGSYSRLAGVECSNETDGQPYQLRLWGGPTSNSGLLQVWFNGTWGTVFNDRFNWRSARVACRQLGYANGRPLYNSVFGQAPDLVWLVMGTCTGSESRLVDCEGSYFYEYTNGRNHNLDVGVVCNNDPEPMEGAVRLVGGPTPNRGQVEIYLNGTWGGVCWDDSFRWEAAVICRQLNYSGGGWFDQPQPGRETPTWASKNFAPNWWTTYQCVGNETRLTQCPSVYGVVLAWYDNYCRRPLSVVCSTDTLPPEGSLRLVRPIGGTTGSLAAVWGSSLPNNSYGTLQVLRGSRWGLVSVDGFGWQEARVACRQLGFKSGRAVGGVTYDPGLGLPYWAINLGCVGNETRLVDCPHVAYNTNDRNQWYSYQPEPVAGLVCSSDPEPAPHSVRLVGGPGPHAGRLEVYGANPDLPTWATVCLPNDWYFDWRTVRVVCRQLGYNKGGRAVGVGIFGQGVSTPSWLAQPVTRMLRSVCSGTEARLDACAYPAPADPNTLTCYDSHGQDAGVWCDTATDEEPPNGALRLMNGPGAWAGRLEVFHNGLWGAVCTSDFTLEDAQVVCRQLGFTGGRIPPYFYYQFGYGTMVAGSPYLLHNMSCTGSETAISACPGVASARAYTSNCNYGSYNMHLMCEPQPRGLVSTAPTVVDAGRQAPSRVGDIWLAALQCPDDSLPSGFSLKLDSPSWESSYFYLDTGDTAGVTDLRLDCYQDGALLATLSQSDNFWPWTSYGTWSRTATCPTATVNGTTVRPYFTGVRLRVLGDVNDTTDSVNALGVTDIEFRCSDNRTVTGGGFPNGTWGTWAACPAGTALCGVSSQMRYLTWCRGEAGDCDDTAMTGLRIQCCYMPAGFVNVPGRRTLRLAGGTSPQEGRVEMLIGGVWGMVYQDNWDDMDALVACKQLGWPTGAALTNAGRSYGTGALALVRSHANCTGSEAALQSCGFRSFSPENPVENYGREYSAGAICRADPVPSTWGALRLRDDLPLLWATGGATRRLMGSVAGRLEVFWNGRWGTLNRNPNVNDDGTAIVACKTLGYRSGRAVQATEFGPIFDAPPIWNRNVMCAGNEASLLDCPSDGWRAYSRGVPDYVSGYNDLGLICSNDTVPAPGALRLRGGAVPSEGALEVYWGNTWAGVGYPYAYSWYWPATWDLTDAIVTCKQLGYKSGLPATRGGWGSSNTFWLKDVACRGTESNLTECFRANNNTYSWWTGYADNQAGVICSNDTLPATGALRLAGALPGAPGFGRLEVAVNGMWGSVYGPRWGWPESQVACRSLGYKMAVYWRYEVGYPLNDLPVWLGSVKCLGNETALSHCRNGTVYGPPPDAGDAGSPGQPVWAGHRVVLDCTNATSPPVPMTLRLMGLPMPYAGRLEVFYNGAWSALTIENRDANGYYVPATPFGPVEAGVACRTLGYEPLYGSNASYSFVASGLGEPYTGVPVLSFNLSCTGAEYSLWDCSRLPMPYMLYDGAPYGSSNEPRTSHASTVGIYCKAPPDASKPLASLAAAAAALASLSPAFSCTAIAATTFTAAPQSAPISPFSPKPAPFPAPSPPAPPPPGPEFRLGVVIPSALPQAGGQLTITGQFDVGGAEGGGVVFRCAFSLTDPALGGSGVQRSNATAIRTASGTTLRCDAPAAPTPAATLRLNVSRSPARPGFGSGAEVLSYGTPITYYGPCPADCNGNGLCRLGTCTCQEGWTGADCATAVPLPRIANVTGAPPAGGTLRVLEGARWTAQPRLAEPLPAATWVLSSEYAAASGSSGGGGGGMSINAATGFVEWSAAVAKGVGGDNSTSVVISVIDQTSGRVVSYSFFLVVVPLYALTDLRLNSSATAGAGGLVPGGRAVFSGRVAYTHNASAVLAAGGVNITNTTLPPLAGRRVVVVVRPQLQAAGAVAGGGVGAGSGAFTELGTTVGANGTFTAEWPVPLTAQGAHDVFALHPAATFNASATTPLNSTATSNSSNATQPSQPPVFQLHTGVFVSFISAAVDRSAFNAAGGLDPRYALPTLPLDPGRSSLLDPFANLLGAAQDLRSLVTSVRTRLVYTAGGVAPTLQVNATSASSSPVPLCGNASTAAAANSTIALSYGLDNATIASLCVGVTNASAATAPGASRLGLRVQQTNSSGATAAAEFEVTVELRGGVSGAATKLLLRVLVDTARVELATDPPGGALAAVLPRGGAAVVRLAVTNNGNVPSASLLLPAGGSWLTCLTPLPLPPLNPGATALVDFRFAVPPGAQLGDVFTASTDVRGSDGRGSAPLRFELAVASEPTGSLEVTVVDEYTTYDPAAPKVAGARLVLRGQDGRVLGEGRTNTSGVCVFPNLTAGYTYAVDAFSANHTSTTRTVTITGGPRLLRIFMSRVAVKATFAVVPTSFQEEVQFIVNVEYVTFVPMPVVRLEPALIFIEDLQVGSTHTLRVINTGLVAAFNTRLRIPASSPDFDIAFMRAYWVQADNATRNNETADVLVYPYGPASQAAWAGAGAGAPDSTAGASGSGASQQRRRQLGGIAAPVTQVFVTPDDYLPMTLVVGRMPAMSELVLELVVQKKQLAPMALLGRSRRRLQGGGGCGWSTNIQLSFSDPCDPSKSNVVGGVSITSRNPPGPQCTAGCCAGSHITIVGGFGGGGGGGSGNPWFSFTHESPPTPDLCDKCAADMLEIGLCLGKDLLAPWNKPLSNALEVLGEVYDVIKEVAPDVTVTTGRRLLVNEEPAAADDAAAVISEPGGGSSTAVALVSSAAAAADKQQQPLLARLGDDHGSGHHRRRRRSTLAGGVVATASGMSGPGKLVAALLKDKVVGKIPVLGCLLNPALDCAGFWDAVEDKVDNLLGSVGGAPGAMRRRRQLLREVSGLSHVYGGDGGGDGSYDSGYGQQVYGSRTADDASSVLALAAASGSAADSYEATADVGGGGSGGGGLGCSRGGLQPGGRRGLLVQRQQQPGRRQLGGIYIEPQKTTSPILFTAPGKAIIRWSSAIIAMHAAAAEMWGLEHYMSWLNPGYPKDVNAAWTAAWEAATSDGSAGGVLVDWVAEAPALLADTFTPLVPVEARQALLARWNATYDPAWAAGLNSSFSSPPSPIDLALVRQGQLLYLNETRAALEAGFTSVFDALDQAIMSLVAVHVTAASSGGGAGQATCARVVVQISQRLVLTRQAFEASLQLDNAGSAFTLANVSVALTAWLKDNGTEVAAAFAIGQPVVEGMTPDPAAPGAWLLAAGGVASVRWLLVPREAAALAADTWYFIGGVVSYVPGAGLPLELLPLEPADVRVSPEGRLAVRYYIEKDVQGDNPFTPNVTEPSLPATLATLLLNVGRGPSLGLVMDSLQPQIVENEKGLLVGFNITGVAVNGVRQPEALRAAIGDVPAGGAALVTWDLTCTLQGTFSGINATFVARNPLNDPTLSSIASLDLYDMTHLTWITGAAWDDGLPDMLVTGVSNTTNSVGNLTAAALMNASMPLPTQLHSSRDGIVFPVQAVTAAALASSAVQPVSPPAGFGGTWIRLTLRVRGSLLQPPPLLQSPAGSSPSGWQYIRLDTPAQLRPSTGWVLTEAAAAPGNATTTTGTTTQIKLPYNAWTSYRAYSDPAKAKDYVHVLYDGYGMTPKSSTKASRPASATVPGSTFTGSARTAAIPAIPAHTSQSASAQPRASVSSSTESVASQPPATLSSAKPAPTQPAPTLAATAVAQASQPSASLAVASQPFSAKSSPISSPT